MEIDWSNGCMKMGIGGCSLCCKSRTRLAASKSGYGTSGCSESRYRDRSGRSTKRSGLGWYPASSVQNPHRYSVDRCRYLDRDNSRYMFTSHKRTLRAWTYQMVWRITYSTYIPYTDTVSVRVPRLYFPEGKKRFGFHARRSSPNRHKVGWTCPFSVGLDRDMAGMRHGQGSSCASRTLGASQLLEKLPITRTLCRTEVHVQAMR